MKWQAYRRKRGTLNPSLRMDRAAALLASILATAHFTRKDGRDWSLEDFLPFGDEDPIDLDTAMQEWS